jgi:hypothetical protein
MNVVDADLPFIHGLPIAALDKNKAGMSSRKDGGFLLDSEEHWQSPWHTSSARAPLPFCL